MPQIEVAFDIDANGILHVSAKDKNTGKEANITIKASSGLTEEEIQRMVKDAEAHAEEDRKFHELVMARNQADSLAYGVEKSLRDLGDQVEAEEKGRIEAALTAVREAIQGEDKTVIEQRTQALAEVSATLAQRAATAAQARTEGAEAVTGDADVVDAEFHEVKDDKSA
jgi:molecular chaperone DnaK